MAVIEALKILNLQIVNWADLNDGFDELARRVNELEPPVPKTDLEEFAKWRSIIRNAVKPRTGYNVSDTMMSESLVRRRSRDGTWASVIYIICRDSNYTRIVRNLLRSEISRGKLIKCPFTKIEPIVEHNPNLKPSSFLGLPRVERVDGKTELKLANRGFAPKIQGTNSIRVKASNAPDSPLKLIGGVILVNNQLYGLAVCHEAQETVRSGKDAAGDRQEQDHTDNSEDFADEITQDQSFDVKISHETSEMARLVKRHFPRSTFDMATDWSLFELETPFLPVNQLDFSSSAGKNCTVMIDEIVTEEEFIHVLQGNGENQQDGRVRCVVITTEKILPAFAEAGTHTLQWNEGNGDITFEVLRIVSGTPMSTGLSGAWVLVGSRLLGTVIATQRQNDESGLSFAFVLPIEATFRSISRAMGDAQVSLPAVIDNEIMAIERQIKYSRWIQNSQVLKQDSTYPGRLVSRSEEQFAYELLIAQRQERRNWTKSTPTNAKKLWNHHHHSHPELTKPIIIPSYFQIQTRGTRAKLYQRVTKLRYETIDTLILLGQAFPVSPNFRSGMRTWIRKNRVSKLQGSKGVAATMLMEDCSVTEAGENFMALFFILRRSQNTIGRSRSFRGRNRRYSEVKWLVGVLSALLEAFDIPSTNRPSEPQLHLFTHLCFCGFKDFELDELDLPDGFNEPVGKVDMKSEPRLWLPQTKSLEHSSDSTFMNPAGFKFKIPEEAFDDPQGLVRMLVNVSKIAGGIDSFNGPRKNPTHVLVCSGFPWAEWCENFAKTVLGLNVDSRIPVKGSNNGTQNQLWQKIVTGQPAAVIAYWNQDITISEVVDIRDLALKE